MTSREEIWLGFMEAALSGEASVQPLPERAARDAAAAADFALAEYERRLTPRHSTEQTPGGHEIAVTNGHFEPLHKPEETEA